MGLLFHKELLNSGKRDFTTVLGAFEFEKAGFTTVLGAFGFRWIGFYYRARCI